MKLMNLIFPKQCVCCGQTGEYLCKDCKKNLKPHPEICPYCHRFSANYQTCLNCKLNRKNYLDGLIITFCYSDWIKKLILRLKYYHRKDVGDFLAERLGLAIQSNQLFQFIIPNSSFLISYVPSHRYRHYFRKWYNQSEILAKKLEKKIWLPVINLFKKVKNTHSQTDLKRNQRLENLKNVFQLNEWLKLNGNETIIIVDDITTTGATLNELAKLVKNKWPKIKVWWLVLGRHIG